MEQKQSKGVWNWTRVCFYAMLLFWVLGAITLEDESTLNYLLVGLPTLTTIIATFVLSIIHLRRYEKKGLAVTALVISSIGVLLVFIGMLSAL